MVRSGGNGQPTQRVGGWVWARCCEEGLHPEVAARVRTGEDGLPGQHLGPGLLGGVKHLPSHLLAALCGQASPPCAAPWEAGTSPMGTGEREGLCSGWSPERHFRAGQPRG